MSSRFHLIPQRNGQTDGRTDGRTDRSAISISRVSMLTRDKNRAVGILKLTTDKDEASRGLSATAELLIKFVYCL